MCETDYRSCTRCIMDTSDPEITFDEHGVCNHCKRFDTYVKANWFPNEEGMIRLKSIIEKIKQEGSGKEYDSIMGLSGGIDSSYMAYQVHRLGLRPLVVHVDCGWNSEIAVRNIENIVKILGLELYTHVVDWEEMRDLQIAFLRSGVANQDTPQDHAIFAFLYNFAKNNRIRYILSGSNFATECILPRAWGHTPMDLRQLKSIHHKFGKKKLKLYPSVGFFRFYFYYLYILKMKVVCPLNFMPYNKKKAMKILEAELSWEYYGKKHHESQFTRFFQTYYLPKKFGYEKRRAHLASLVVTNQMSRNEALAAMKEPYSEKQLREDKEYIIKKLRLNENEFDQMIELPGVDFKEYPSCLWFLNLKDSIKPLFRPSTR